MPHYLVRAGTRDVSSAASFVATRLSLPTRASGTLTNVIACDSYRIYKQRVAVGGVDRRDAARAVRATQPGWFVPTRCETPYIIIIMYVSLRASVMILAVSAILSTEPLHLSTEPLHLADCTKQKRHCRPGVRSDLVLCAGGTPNLSNNVRAIPQSQFVPAWYRVRFTRTLPHELFSSLSLRAQKICREIVASPSGPAMPAATYFRYSHGADFGQGQGGRLVVPNL